MQSNTDFVDMQVKLLIRRYPNCCINELVKNAIELFPMFKWNYDKIRNSIVRITKKNPNYLLKRISKESVHLKSGNIKIRQYNKIRLMVLIVNDKLK